MEDTSLIHYDNQCILLRKGIQVYYSNSEEDVTFQEGSTYSCLGCILALDCSRN